MIKVAHILKPWIELPARGYGAIERIVQSLLEKSEKYDFDYELYANRSPIEWMGSEKQFSLFDGSMTDQGHDRNLEAAQSLYALKRIARSDIDIIHWHALESALVLESLSDKPMVMSYYNEPSLASVKLTEMCDKTYFVFASKHNMSLFPKVKHGQVIYSGLDINKFPFIKNKQNYLSYVGAISEKKGVHTAIDVAKRTNNKLVIAGKIKSQDTEYFMTQIKPHLDGKQIVFIGEVNDDERNQIIGNSKAYIFPIQWNEPFATSILESLVVGTPVITYNIASTPEIIEHGANGFLCNSVDDFVKSISKLNQINLYDCRKTIEEKFTSDIMAQKYAELYRQMLNQ